MSRVIYINGPSSAGKSTLIRALQNELSETYLRIGIDPMIGMMPSRLNDWSEGIIRTSAHTTPGFCWNFAEDTDGSSTHTLMSGAEGKRIVDLLHTMARTVLSSGYSIIIDDVALGGSHDIERWRKTLEGYSVLWIGLTAPLKVLEEREHARGDRAIGSSRTQVDLVHQGGIQYDYFFDTSEISLQEMVQKIVTKF